MEEILFRAKRLDNNEWVDGYYAVIGNKTVIIKKEPEFFYDEYDEKEEQQGNAICAVNPDTLHQIKGTKHKDCRKLV